MTRPHRFLIALLAAGALVVTGCGGDDDDTSAAASASEASASASEETEEIDPEAVENAAEAVGLGEDCAEVVAAFAAVAGSAGSAMSGNAEGDLEESLEAFEAYAEVAPEEIRDDMEQMAEAYGEFVRAIADSGWDSASGEMPPEEVMAALEDLDTDELTEASNRVSAYFESERGAGG